MSISLHKMKPLSYLSYFNRNKNVIIDILIIHIKIMSFTVIHSNFLKTLQY